MSLSEKLSNPKARIILPIAVIAIVALFLFSSFNRSPISTPKSPTPVASPGPCHQTPGLLADDIAAAKALAHSNNRLLVVMVGSSACPWCQQAKADVLNKPEWQSYAQAKGLSLVFADMTRPSMSAVLTQLQTLYNSTSWPYFLVFEMQPAANLTNANLDSSNVRLVGKFRYRAGEDTINGITVVRNSPSNFISIFESFTGSITDCI